MSEPGSWRSQLLAKGATIIDVAKSEQKVTVTRPDTGTPYAQADGTPWVPGSGDENVPARMLIQRGEWNEVA